ncbi:zinc-dependent metalloprotease [Salinibacterium amurskyense]|uniref:zinc-dependent metalloprotease n=1 Tax=Salinibacterium amurskyense TaxID=205941 RepID=UPI00311EF409
MADNAENNSEDEFRDMMRDFLSGDGEIDPAKLAGAAGLPNDPAMIQQLLSQLQNALGKSGDGINWDIALEQAKNLASQSTVVSLPAERSKLEQAMHVAALWLNEVTDISELTVEPKLLSRSEWVTITMPIWTQLAEPVANSIANSLTDVLKQNAPEEMTDMLSGASKMMRNIGGTLFAMQLGQVVGQLSSEVVSGGDIGIPLFDEQQAVLVPQSVFAFGNGLDLPDSEIHLYLSVRELASDFDPNNPEELRDAMTNGSLIPPKSEEQREALERLETVLALVEGWVDVVTAAATSRLPAREAIAETVRRRRASGGPAESAFATLVGLELRPRRLREAAAMWQHVTDELGAEQRDSLWSHPDLMPTAADIDDPAALVARLRDGGSTPDDIDQAINDLLNDESGDRPHEGDNS